MATSATVNALVTICCFEWLCSCMAAAAGVAHARGALHSSENTCWFRCHGLSGASVRSLWGCARQGREKLGTVISCLVSEHGPNVEGECEAAEVPDPFFDERLLV